MPGPAVEVREISMQYDASARVLDRVSLAVGEGERLCLLGPSGSGKTTLLQLIAGFLTPSEGSIQIAGRDQTHVPASRRNLGIVFQNLALFPHMSVADNVAYGLKARRADKAMTRQKVTEALDMVGLSGFAHRRPRQLSGGQQQRVAFARAIAFDPAALLLDEPFSSLDTALRKTIRAELMRLQEEVQVPTILVTHDQEEALAFGHKLAVINRGRVEQFGTPEELYESPQTRFTAQFLGGANFIPGAVVAAAEGTADVSLLGATARSVALPTPGTTVSTGTTVEVLVRPDRVGVMPRGTATQGCVLPGTVVRSTYLGETVEFHIQVGEGSVTAKVPGASGIGGGALVDVVLPDGGLRLFPAGRDGAPVAEEVPA